MSYLTLDEARGIVRAALRNRGPFRDPDLAYDAMLFAAAQGETREATAMAIEAAERFLPRMTATDYEAARQKERARHRALWMQQVRESIWETGRLVKGES